MKKKSVLDKSQVLEHPVIKKIIEELSLNKNQIQSGLDLFLKVIEEHNNKENLEFITKIEIYDENSIVGISIPNKKLLENIKRHNYLFLDNISNLDFINFSHPRTIHKEGEIDRNIFYWIYPGTKTTNDRSGIARWLKEFYTNTNENKYTKGFFLHGSFGVGKTYCLMAFANYVIEKQISVSYININDLYDFFIKNIDKNSELNTITVNKMKNIDILLIDDIGGEKSNSWFLFNILYPILEYRLKLEKTTCFSSIFSINELKKYWNKNKELDNVKVLRLIDKITSLTKQIEFKGKNIREIKNH